MPATAPTPTLPASRERDGTKFIYANNGAYGSADSRQDLWVTLGEGVSSDNGWIGGDTSGDLYGDIDLRLAEGAIGKIHGIRHCERGHGIHGDIYLEVSCSTGAYEDLPSPPGRRHRTSVAEPDATAVNGDITMVFNDGVILPPHFRRLLHGKQNHLRLRLPFHQWRNVHE